MSKNKNFSINRVVTKTETTTRVDRLPVGDVFGKDGSLHMVTEFCHEQTTPDKVCVCNLNTGAVWYVDAELEVSKVKNTSISYEVVL